MGDDELEGITVAVPDGYPVYGLVITSDPVGCTLDQVRVCT